MNKITNYPDFIENPRLQSNREELRIILILSRILDCKAIGINKKKIFIFFVVLLTTYYLLPTARIQAQTNVTLYSVSPTSGAVGDPVVITGSNLLYCAPVYAGGNLNNRCNVQFHDINFRRSTDSGIEISDSQINAVVPWHCPGTTTIRVGELTDFSNSIPFTILDTANVPEGCRIITSIAPISGTFGTVVTISGSNLHSNVQLYDSSFGKTDVTGTMNAGATQVTFIVPNNFIPGTYTVRVGPSVSDVSNGLPFNFIGDTTAPFISNIRINNITTTGASVLWDTNELADGQVEICPTLTRCGTNTPLITTLTTAHLVNLSGLTANTRYYLWVKSKDGRGNLATGGPMSFRTLSVPTPTPTARPVVGVVVVSNVQVTNFTRYTATVTWDTDRPSDSRVSACAFQIFCYRSLAYDSNLTTSHSLNISALKANTTYSIQAQSIASNGEYGSSNIFSFRTQPGLIISDAQASNITSSGATVTWNTNYPADSGVIICTYFLFCYVYTPTAYDADLTLNHSLNVSGLLPNRRYYFRILSADSESTANSSLQSFTTLN